MADPAVLIPLPALLLAWMVAGGSPGPATLAISGTSMQVGRGAGAMLAAGIVCGSATWGAAAALGLSAVMMANVWLFEVLRYFGAAYVLFLASKFLRSALSGKRKSMPPLVSKHLFLKGFLLHLTNPKAVLAWASVYAIALTPGADPAALWRLFAILICGSMVLFFGCAVLFSWAVIARGYLRAQRVLEAAFALLFGLAALKILTARLT